MISNKCIFRVLFLLPAFFAFTVSADKEKKSDDIYLKNVVMSGVQGALLPNFSPEIRHYYLRYYPGDVVGIAVVANDDTENIRINGVSYTHNSVFQLPELTPDSVIKIELLRKNKKIEYQIQYVPNDFLTIDVTKINDSVSDGLFFATPNYIDSVSGLRNSYLLIFDRYGVPRYYRKMDSRTADFKLHRNGMLSYAVITGRNEFGLADRDIVLLSTSRLKNSEKIGLNKHKRQKEWGKRKKKNKKNKKNNWYKDRN